MTHRAYCISLYGVVCHWSNILFKLPAQAWQHPTLRLPCLLMYDLADRWSWLTYNTDLGNEVCCNMQRLRRDSTDRSDAEHKSYLATCKLLQPYANWDISEQSTASANTSHCTWLSAAFTCTSFDLFDLMRLPCQVLCCERAAPTIMHSANCHCALQSIHHTEWNRPTLVGNAEKPSISTLIVTKGEKTR